MELSRVDGHEDEDSGIRIEGQPGQSVILGRGQLLQIAEAGLSRKMAKITLTKESKSWILEAIHEAKPCYHDKAGDFKPLMPGERVKIVDGLQFSLAINKYIFRVKLVRETKSRPKSTLAPQSKTHTKAVNKAEKSGGEVLNTRSSRDELKGGLKENPVESIKDDREISPPKSPRTSLEAESGTEMEKDPPNSAKDNPVESAKVDPEDSKDKEEEEMDCDSKDKGPNGGPKEAGNVVSSSQNVAIHSNGEVKATTSKSETVVDMLKQGDPVEIAKKRDLPKWMNDLSIESAMLSTPNGTKKEKKDTKGRAKTSSKAKDIPMKSNKKPHHDDDDKTEDESIATAKTSSKSKDIPMKGNKKPHYGQDDETEDDSKAPKKRPAKTSVNKPSAKKKVPPRKDSREARNGKDRTVQKKKPQAIPRGKHALSSSESDTDEDVEMAAVPSSKKPVKTSHVASKPKKSATRKRKQCQFGSNCYRKNLQHRKELSHPGDQDYGSDSNDSKQSDTDTDNKQDSGSEGDRPECDFGKNCYRKNPQHRKQFKHTTNPRPKRKAKTAAAAKKGSDSEYDSSFIDDDSDVKDISHDETSEEEYVPSDDD